jgi:hypothetical protein
MAENGFSELSGLSELIPAPSQGPFHSSDETARATAAAPAESGPTADSPVFALAALISITSCSNRTSGHSSRTTRGAFAGSASQRSNAPSIVRRGGALRSTTAELIRVKRHEFPDAHRRPAGHALHAVRQPIIPTRPVQLGHRHRMPRQVLRQPMPFQLPFPVLGGISE